MSVEKLPEGWVKTDLQNVALWGSGGTPSRSHDEYYNGNIPWIKTGDLGPKIITDASEYLTDEGIKNSSAKFFSKGSVAIAMYGATIGKTSILGIDATTNQACAVGSPLDGIITTLFLYYFLLNEKSAFIKKGKGGAQPNISQSVIKDHMICLPPLAEQKIIAEKLDTLLAQVDSTKARLEQIPKILKRFRLAVLASSLNGKIINQNYKEKNSVLSSFVSIDMGNAFKSSEFSETGIPLLRGQNIEPGSLRWDETKRFPLEKLRKFSHLFINEGDIILAMDRPIISSGLKLAKAKEIDIPCVLVQRVARFKDFKGLLPDYLYLLLKDLAFINYIQPNQTGSDIPHISGKQILNFNCNIPPLPEQREIVRRVEQLFVYADTIEKQVNNALARVNNLTQSILAKAFRGELTAQWRAENPELISGENSAAALLEKIKAERAASTGKKASRKKS
ncbi:restriction endonuclease subunit S [Pantoea sp.]|uniref:restriction endonuclease subunit S n=1 Tax=Pantoea sp. TaxID=69393 RepID=UPI0025D13951|nr:restriction endonuclease subunit S [Pantoea sp.]